MDVNYPVNQNGSVQTSSYTTLYLPAGQVSGEGIASAEDYAVCRQIMREASKNYSSASNYLPADRQPHVEALYALMRVGDDRVDVTHEGFRSPLEAIDDWEREYWKAFESGDSPQPVLRAYLDTSRKFGIPTETMADYFRAMRDDLTITRFPTFNDLLHYMDGSAIPVGRAMTYILGVNHPHTLDNALTAADSLSIAMQLSNFWRDIGEDWRIGRIYLPLEDMDYFRYTEEDLASQRINTNLVHLLEFEFERTETYYQTARVGVQMLASGQVAVMSALEIYRAILLDIRNNRYNVFTRRAGTGALKKLSLVARAFWMVR
jgi:15-cis-phytoene synthase